MIHAEIIADSVGPNGARITTYLLTYPRFIHSEFMTHRAFSRNASSSRAIPVKRQVRNIIKDMAVPIHIGHNRAGMQADGEVSDKKRALAVFLWKALGYLACGTALLLDKLGVHKQVANRVIEPWSHITVVVTSTDWKNFFKLRDHADAQPEMAELAARMRRAIAFHVPRVLKAGQWHLPFVYNVNGTPYEKHVGYWIKVSVARCARTSYFDRDGRKTDPNKDVELHDRLLKHDPMHASPAEHQAKATNSLKRSGNLRGWVQYRKTLKGECADG